MSFLFELPRGVERAGEPLMLSTCTHTILLGSERLTLNAYPCQFLLAQCREIIDSANATDGSVAARWLHDGVHVVSHPPPLMPILGRGRRYVLGCRGMQKLSRCCCFSRRTGFESQTNKGQSSFAWCLSSAKRFVFMVTCND